MQPLCFTWLIQFLATSFLDTFCLSVRFNYTCYARLLLCFWVLHYGGSFHSESRMEVSLQSPPPHALSVIHSCECKALLLPNDLHSVYNWQQKLAFNSSVSAFLATTHTISPVVFAWWPLSSHNEIQRHTFVVLLIIHRSLQTSFFWSISPLFRPRLSGYRDCYCLTAYEAAFTRHGPLWLPNHFCQTRCSSLAHQKTILWCYAFFSVWFHPLLSYPPTTWSLTWISFFIGTLFLSIILFKRDPALLVVDLFPCNYARFHLPWRLCNKYLCCTPFLKQCLQGKHPTTVWRNLSILESFWYFWIVVAPLLFAALSVQKSLILRQNNLAHSSRLSSSSYELLE